MHELEIDRAGRASFCYNHRNGNPWHKLGVPFERVMTIDEALKACRADRIAEKFPMHAVTPGGVLDSSTSWMTAWPSVDDPGVWVELGTVGSDYKLVQYSQFAEIAGAIVDQDRDGAFVDTMGLLFDGKRFFMFIDFGDTEIVLPNGARDRFTKGLGAMTSMDGTQSMTFAKSTLRWVCNNTVTAGIEMATGIVRIRHTEKADERLRQVRELLELGHRGCDTEFEQLAWRLGGIPGSDDLLDKVISKLWAKPDVDATDRSKSIYENRRDKIHDLFRADSNAGNYGENGWAVFNTIVEFVDHVQGKDPEARARGAIDISSTAQGMKAHTVKVLLGATS